MSEELKPCPFCSDTPDLPSGDGTQYDIECGGCGQAMVAVQICDLMTLDERCSDNFTDYRYADEFVERAKKEAIERWNTRAELSAIKGGGGAVGVIHDMGFGRPWASLSLEACKNPSLIGCELYTRPPVVAEAEPVTSTGLLKRLVDAEPYLTDKVHYTCDSAGDYRTYYLELYIPTPAAAPEPFEIAAAKWIGSAPPASGAVPVPRELLERLSERGDGMGSPDFWAARAEIDALLAKDATPPAQGFHIGQPVRKVTGEYRITGEVRSVFTKADGTTRLVVEHNAEGGGSFLHIYGPQNLEVE